MDIKLAAANSEVVLFEENAQKLKEEMKSAKIHKAQVVRVAEVDLSSSSSGGPLALCDATTKAVTQVTNKVEIGDGYDYIDADEFLNSDLLANLDPNLPSQLLALADGTYVEVSKETIKAAKKVAKKDAAAEGKSSASSSKNKSSSSKNEVAPHEVLRASLGDKDVGSVPLRLELANTSYGAKNGQNLLAIGDDAGDVSADSPPRRHILPSHSEP